MNKKSSKQTKINPKKINKKSKQKTKNKKQKSKFKNIVAIFFVVVLAILAVWFSQNDSQTIKTPLKQEKQAPAKTISNKQIQQLKDDINIQKNKKDIFSKIHENTSTNKLYTKSTTPKITKINQTKTTSQTQITAKNKELNTRYDEVSVFDDDLQSSSINNPPKQSKFFDTFSKKPSLPYLTIIIDDIATKHHANLVKSTNLPITPSIFPPSSYHPHTPQIAKDFDVFMVHLPMEALNFTKEEKHTLRVGDSYDEIFQTLSKVKKDFKGLKFYNNHTGSKFTSDYDSMVKLLDISDKLGLVFLDSKTIASSKAKDIRKAQNRFYFTRDIFLDNKDDEEYVKSQLQAAIKLAHKKGYAIAIGHPRLNTINAIKNTDFSSVRLIKIDKMYEFLRYKR